MRVLSALVGNMTSQIDMQTKYSGLFEALSHKVTVAGHYDARLQGVARYWNAVQTFDPSVKRWRERFFRNVPAFRMRSTIFAHHLRRMTPPVDVILQVGALFDSTWEGSIPVVLYTDNTSAITARYPQAGRFAFNTQEQDRWMMYEKTLYERAAHVCVRSTAVQKSLLTEYNIQPEKVTVIGGGVNFPSLPTLTVPDSDREPTILFIGQNFYRKGGDLALKAFSLARKAMPNARMFVVTNDPIPVDLPMEGVSHVETGWDRTIIASLYRRSDVFVLPARQETWGDVLLEAMAFGIPCVGIVGQAMEDIIQNERTGLLVENQVEVLAEAFVRLLSQRQLCQEMGLAARTRIELQFTWDIVADRLFSVLSSIVQREHVTY
jgi:glycosyltransferase involved in cell wall biosynthesis